MSSRSAVKIVRVGVPAEIEQDWNDWYNNQYIAARLRVPGFLSARRFEIYEGGTPRYLTVFELADVRVLSSDSYLGLRGREASLSSDSFEAITPTLPGFSCSVYRQIYPDWAYAVPDTPIIFAAGIDVPTEKEAEFNAWYNTDHIAALEKVPGFVTARRFVAGESPLPPQANLTLSGPKYLALYDITSEDVLKSAAFYQAAQSPWTTWVHSWYHRHFALAGRCMFETEPHPA